MHWKEFLNWEASERIALTRRRRGGNTRRRRGLTQSREMKSEKLCFIYQIINESFFTFCIHSFFGDLYSSFPPTVALAPLSCHCMQKKREKYKWNLPSFPFSQFPHSFILLHIPNIPLVCASIYKRFSNRKLLRVRNTIAQRSWFNSSIHTRAKLHQQQQPNGIVDILFLQFSWAFIVTSTYSSMEIVIVSECTESICANIVVVPSLLFQVLFNFVSIHSNMQVDK